jgi:hypothetical protein
LNNWGDYPKRIGHMKKQNVWSTTHNSNSAFS